MKPCIVPPRKVFLFHSPVELLHSWSTGLQSKMFWGFLLLKPILRLGSLNWGSKLSLLLENLCDIIIFQFVVTHLADMRFDYVAKASLCLSLFGFFFSFDCKISLL